MLQASCYRVINYAYPSQLCIQSYMQSPVLETFSNSLQSPGYVPRQEEVSPGGGGILRCCHSPQREEFQWLGERPVWISVFCFCILGRGEK